MLTLRGVFAGSVLVVAGVVASIGLLALDGTRRTILEAAERQRAAGAEHVALGVRGELERAERALREVEAPIAAGAIDLGDPRAVEVALFAQVASDPRIAEATFTGARRTGFGADGSSVLEPTGRFQISVLRHRDGAGERLLTRRLTQENGVFVLDVGARPVGSSLFAVPFERGPAPADPTTHLTFSTTASQRFRGRAIWSDLQWSEADLALPEASRRVEVTVQKAIENGAGDLLGVVRVGMFTEEVDAIVRRHEGVSDAHRVFLFDDDGRLVTRFADADRLTVVGDDLRMAPTSLPEEVARALSTQEAHTLAQDGAIAAVAFDVGGRRFLGTFQALVRPTHWNVGVVVPEDAYTGELSRQRRRAIGIFAAVLGGIALLGFVVLRALRRGLAEIVDRTGHVRAFDFAPRRSQSPFRDVQEAMDGLERAKTVLRAIGKYVPISLVRQLFEANEEPALGGEPARIAMMFTDIEGFTSLSEVLAPTALARALGAYLEAMTNGVEENEGTVDKFIGDAVMAIWNAPKKCASPAHKACEGVLRCIERTRELFASETWKGLSPLVTRYGVHEDDVLVGHFGAPTRFSYTALGDGVNLAARLEGLCKQYGVITLVSEVVAKQVRDAYVLRHVDRVAVKGKSRAVEVYELLGRQGEDDPRTRFVADYERALSHYFAREFAEALAIVEAMPEDPPSVVLGKRCRELMEKPPAEGWDGVFVAKSK